MKNNYIFFLSTIALCCTIFSATAQRTQLIPEVPYQECHTGDSTINSAIIFIYRTNKGAARDLQVYLDDTLFTSLKKGSYYELHTKKKGQVQLTTSDAKGSLSFNIVHGRAYYIQSELCANGKTKIKFVEPEVGYNEVMNIREGERSQVRANPF